MVRSFRVGFLVLSALTALSGTAVSAAERTVSARGINVSSMVRLPLPASLCHHLNPPGDPLDQSCDFRETTNTQRVHDGAHITDTTTFSVEICSRKWFCGIWDDLVTFTAKWDGSSVWSVSLSCSTKQASWPFYIKRSWCGTWNNGGGHGYRYMNAGDNFTVCDYITGCIGGDHWQRINVGTDGRYWATGN